MRPIECVRYACSSLSHEACFDRIYAEYPRVYFPSKLSDEFGCDVSENANKRIGAAVVFKFHALLETDEGISTVRRPLTISEIMRAFHEYNIGLLCDFIEIRPDESSILIRRLSLPSSFLSKIEDSTSLGCVFRNTVVASRITDHDDLARL